MEVAFDFDLNYMDLSSQQREENTDFNFYKDRLQLDTQTKTTDLYYANFSKYVLDVKPQKKISELYFYSKWKMDSTEIERISLQTLKASLRHNNCRVSGNKAVLIDRLRAHYRKIDQVIHIQRVFRGFIVRECERLRGPAAKDYTICNNTTDFQTIESFACFPRERFFSYRDGNGFVYGFDIFSLITMYRCKHKLVNPYNREDMPINAIQSLFSIYKKTLLLYPNVLAEKDGEVIDVFALTVANNRRQIRVEDDGDNGEYLTTSESAASIDEYLDEPNLLINYSFVDVFERIQYLVNGEVNSEWFLQLNKAECDRFYHFYYVWWSRSNTLSEDTKNAICRIPNPFSSLNRIDEHSTEAFYKSICLEVMTAMIYTGIDEYHCGLGAKHVLTMLTVVSRPARRVWQNLFDELC